MKSIIHLEPLSFAWFNFVVTYLGGVGAGLLFATEAEQSDVWH